MQVSEYRYVIQFDGSCFPLIMQQQICQLRISFATVPREKGDYRRSLVIPFDSVGRKVATYLHNVLYTKDLTRILSSAAQALECFANFLRYGAAGPGISPSLC